MTYIPPKSDGGPAFPNIRDIDIQRGSVDGHPGLSLLDYFAAKAMQSLINQYNFDPGSLAPDKAVATIAYQLADAMIEQREYWIARRHKDGKADAP